MKKINLLLLIIFSLLTISCSKTAIDDLPDGAKISTVRDIDGNIYRTIKIGTQTWMLENLRVSHYRNGDEIATTSDPFENLSKYSAPQYQWAYNGDESLAVKYGRYYTMSVVTDNRLLAPKGWHIPSTEEWDILINNLITTGHNFDGSTFENKVAKSLASKTDWITSDVVGSPGNDLSKNNSSGFSAIPSGYRWNDIKVYFGGIGYFTAWWTSTILTVKYPSTGKTGIQLNAIWLENYNFCPYKSSVGPYGDALTVRCIKD